MSTRELVHSMIDELSEEQLQALIILLGGTISKKNTVKSVRGIFSDCANPDLIPLEKDAWERAAAEKYEHS
ncbi:MAG: hypothetical protein PUG85_06585 [Oscillospiraceae bacterium]|nr:hypothetical protein [Oscillospiraceae bacterium]MDY2510459.1 hypothetical protein [Ruminococcus callidus]